MSTFSSIILGISMPLLKNDSSETGNKQKEMGNDMQQKAPVRFEPRKLQFMVGTLTSEPQGCRFLFCFNTAFAAAE